MTEIMLNTFDFNRVGTDSTIITDYLQARYDEGWTILFQTQSDRLISFTLTREITE